VCEVLESRLSNAGWRERTHWVVIVSTEVPRLNGRRDGGTSVRKLYDRDFGAEPELKVIGSSE